MEVIGTVINEFLAIWESEWPAYLKSAFPFLISFFFFNVSTLSSKDPMPHFVALYHNVQICTQNVQI